MRLSDAIILYLAAAAPFGAASFMQRRAARASLPRTLLLSACAALAWPAAAVFFLASKGRSEGSANAKTRETDREREVGRIERAVVSAISEVEGLYASLAGGRDEKVRFALFLGRESVVRFAGLARAAGDANLAARPSARELELCRLAGRNGDDLRLAGRCVHRRNVLRLLLNRDRARNEMLRSLGGLHDIRNALPAIARGDQGLIRSLSDSLARVYELVIDLCEALDDRRAVEELTRALEAARAHIQRPGLSPLHHDGTGRGGAEGDVCTMQVAANVPADAHSS